MVRRPRTASGERAKWWGRHPRRRSTDRFSPRDLIYLAALALIAASLWVGIQSNSHAQRADNHAAVADTDALRAIGQVQQGRTMSITVICAVLSSVSEAGRAVIEGSRQPPPVVRERALEALGFPPFAARHAQQATAGRLYVEAISRRVDRELEQVGSQPIRGLVRKDGTIDCRALQRVAALPNPR